MLVLSPILCRREYQIDPFIGIKRAKVVLDYLQQFGQIKSQGIYMSDHGLTEKDSICEYKAVEIQLLLIGNEKKKKNKDKNTLKKVAKILNKYQRQ